MDHVKKLEKAKEKLKAFDVEVGDRELSIEGEKQRQVLIAQIRELEAETETLKASEAPKVPDMGIQNLCFKNGFWCKKLNKSYRSGYYKAKTMKEYKLLITEEKENIK